MKKILLLLLCSLLFDCASSNVVHFDSSDNKCYKIVSIKKKNDFYLIYATKDNILYKIISDKNDSCKNNLIKKGKLYQLELSLAFPVVMNFLDVVPIYKGKPISLERRCEYKVYFAQNLNGLCINTR